MGIGTIVLDPIKVNVSTSLVGLNGLKNATTVNALDVLGGATDAMKLGITSK